ncbi:hypothetical protein [Agromyces aureus]|uniref:DUF3618 domain-containing protein n=1 Tax=Agromyces aureus TaxID=453304 RepID=A0A191WBD0_9MICO|nr:hypothetical protein [Agromyces aureus]ANJ25503.1 hypothetical protein ATC03_00685 [Agromyces aureus]
MTAADAPHTSKRTEKERERNLTRVQARVASEQARADFASTLNALEDKLNLPKQAKRKTRVLKAKLERMADEAPGTLLAVAAGAIAVVGVGVWLIVRASSSDD